MISAIVNTWLGSVAHSFRDKVQLHRAIRSSPERLPGLSNDYLARFLLERLCPAERNFIDVGAHIGSVINGVRRHSRPLKIMAIEAVPEKADALRRKFPAAEIHSCAVGDHEGTVSFFVDLLRPGYSSLERGVNRSVKEITVPLRRLDSLVSPADVGVIKIDVEGAELGVLNGATEIVRVSRPVIMFESGPEKDDADIAALWHWFDNVDYTVFVPVRLAHHGNGLSAEGFLESHLYPRRANNYYGVPRERRDEVRLAARAALGFEI